MILYKRILHADDSPHRIALGAGLATLVAFTPTIGFQTVIALALAALMRANKAICIPIVWISNPLTALPIYGACWKLGQALTSAPPPVSNTNMAVTLGKLAEHTDEGIWFRLFEPEFWMSLLSMMFEFGLVLWVGCLLVGMVAGILTYFATRWGVTEYRQRRRVRKIYRNIRRSRIRKARQNRRARIGNMVGT
ncbi:MAG: DUF2062 domain-containing protein [Phycisphaerae bacterium]|nr:DUF2062 domain-containing protein [Phycisphaerae bacterium]